VQPLQWTGIQREQIESWVAIGWVLTCGVVSVPLNVSSASNCIILMGLAVLPGPMLFKALASTGTDMSQSFCQVLK
jgi:hypothetical protein